MCIRDRCQSSDPNLSCATAHENYEAKVVLDVPVPALNPGQAFVVKKATHGDIGKDFKTVSWSATADHQKEVAESNEGNNVMKGGL